MPVIQSSYFKESLFFKITRTSNQVAWSQCAKLLDEGGLGLKDIEELCEAPKVRGFWRIVYVEDNKSIWLMWMRQNSVGGPDPCAKTECEFSYLEGACCLVDSKDIIVRCVTKQSDGSWPWYDNIPFFSSIWQGIKERILFDRLANGN